MLLLGVVQAQAAGDVSLGSYDLLATEILASATSSVTFSSLGDYAADYQHLQIRMVGRSTTASTGNDEIFMRFNSDTASNYSWHRLNGTGSTVASGAGTSTTYIRAGGVTRNNNTSGMFTAAVIDILDPFETTKYSTTRVLTGHSGSVNTLELASGNWRNTNALTSIYLAPEANSWQTGSRFSLYGLKKASV